MLSGQSPGLGRRDGDLFPLELTGKYGETDLPKVSIWDLQSMDHARRPDSIEWIQTQLFLAKVVNKVPKSFPHHYLHYPIRSKVRYRSLSALRTDIC
jgi:hypothetical protein